MGTWGGAGTPSGHHRHGLRSVPRGLRTPSGSRTRRRSSCTSRSCSIKIGTTPVARAHPHQSAVILGPTEILPRQQRRRCHRRRDRCDAYRCPFEDGRRDRLAMRSAVAAMCAGDLAWVIDVTGAPRRPRCQAARAAASSRHVAGRTVASILDEFDHLPSPFHFRVMTLTENGEVAEDVLHGRRNEPRSRRDPQRFRARLQRRPRVRGRGRSSRSACPTERRRLVEVPDPDGLSFNLGHADRSCPPLRELRRSTRSPTGSTFGRDGSPSYPDCAPDQPDARGL